MSISVIGYVFKADIYCPTCLVEAMIQRGEASPAARDMAPETVLDQIAGANAIDRDDESSFDSDEFPKVILSLGDPETCGQCGHELGEMSPREALEYLLRREGD